MGSDVSKPAAVTDEQVKYVPVDSRLRDANWRHPNDDEPCPPGCREALDQRGDDEGQGLDGYWKWGFKAGWNACAAIATRTPEPQAERNTLEIDDGRNDTFRQPVHGAVLRGGDGPSLVSVLTALTADALWNNSAVMALNAELGLSMDQLLRLARAIALIAEPPISLDWTEDEQWVRSQLQRMILSSRVLVDSDGAVTGYQIKTGALHKLIGRFAVNVPLGLPEVAASPAPAVAPAAVTDEQIDAVWVQVFRNIPGGPRDVRQSHRDFARKVLALTRTPEPQAERGKVLVPLRPTRAMDEVMQQDDWRWADLLEAAEAVTEEEYAQADASDVPPTPEPQAERIADMSQPRSKFLLKLEEAEALSPEARAKLEDIVEAAYRKLKEQPPEPQPDSSGQAREGWKPPREFTTGDDDLNTLLDLTACFNEEGRWNHDTGMQWLDALEKVEAKLAASPTPDEQRAQAAQEDVAPTCPANIIEAISAYGDARADGDVQASMEALPRVITLIRTALAGRQQL